MILLNTKICERVKLWKFSEAVCAIDDEVTLEEKYLLKSLDKFIGNTGDGLVCDTAVGGHNAVGCLLESLSMYLLKQNNYED